MNEKYNPRLTHLAKKLRKGMTREEKHLWYDFLKELPVNIHRQKVFGRYIVDFYCAAVKLVIEIDGSQHYDMEEVSADTIRDNYLNSLGLCVKRYTNIEINKDFESVCKDIYNFIFPDEE